MALSNAVANSILKPGVCTSATRPANPYEGQFIYETDTDYMLVYNGTTWVTPSGSVSAPTTNAQLANKLYVDGLYNTAYARGSLGVTNAATAQTAADNANTNANTRLARSGGTMTGNLFTGGNSIILLENNASLYWNAAINYTVLTGSNVIFQSWAGGAIYIQPNGINFTFKENGIATAPNSWLDNSSIRYKKNIRNFESSDKIDQIQPIIYNYKDDDENKDYFGFIAEDIAELYPELVEYDEDNIPEALAYSRFAVLAISEIKNLRQRLSDLEEKVNELVR